VRSPLATAALAGLIVVPPNAASGQDLSLSAARHLGRPWRTEWTIAYSPTTWTAGPFGAAVVVTSVDGDDGQRHATGLELALGRRGPGRLYLVGTGVVGLGSRGAQSLVAGWSAGLGYTVVSPGPLRLAAEVRYHELSRSPEAVSLGLRLGARFGTSSKAPRGNRSPDSTIAALDPLRTTAEARLRAAAVVETALAAMGTPYLWGGSSANGFDCSGLIQYAYAQHGIQLPRRSTDQAAEGLEVGRDLAQLEVGDILTFGERGRKPVTHVGLYLGGGRFIHSGSQGVTVSTLSPTDPVGRYWWDRWVGSRRVVLNNK
jgi:cell wall-associated NlpC family hydrolase